MVSLIITFLSSFLLFLAKALISRLFLFDMMHKAPLQLLIILLGFSFVLASAAVPATRSLLSHGEESSIQTSLVQGSMELRNGEEMFDMGRMALESTDYPGTGANNRHDPKAPGRS